MIMITMLTALVGEMGPLRGAPRSATVVGAKPGELLQINLKMIKRLNWLYPHTAQKFFFNLITILCDRLENVTHCLSNTCVVDDITAMCTRKGFLEILESENYRARRFNHDLALCLIGIDFEMTGPEPSFETRDRILNAFCETLMRNTRKSDIGGRIDIQTFGLLLPHTSNSKAQMVCARLHKMFEETRFESEGLRLKVFLKDFDLKLAEVGETPPEALLQNAIEAFKDRSKFQPEWV